MGWFFHLFMLNIHAYTIFIAEANLTVCLMNSAERTKIKFPCTNRSTYRWRHHHGASIFARTGDCCAYRDIDANVYARELGRRLEKAPALPVVQASLDSGNRALRLENRVWRQSSCTYRPLRPKQPHHWGFLFLL
jgi:hypothetical protein